MGTIWVDADGCPRGVLHAVEELAEAYGWQYRYVATYAHELNHSHRIPIDQGDQSTDLYIVNHVRAGDIVVTQDIGLAAICQARLGIGIHVSGHVYEASEMEWVLELRAQSAKARRAGYRTKGPKKRTASDDQQFYRALERVLQEANHS
ncbi:DUF188 domain-containing protein [Fodinisporobacter ferrooxydans]|uniref:DUF188 domain-containing protein n=1 Tax=Fodinisporobacter ferrooxydans TaxID=2901836 RepID=A0ABY4CGJ2_9BACL|nr:DUF188 domain-containing protein [Alicyclobacillaceae bacterium MYW30-H2]